MAKTATKVRKKVKKNVAEGIAHIHASFNNTIITMYPTMVPGLHARNRRGMTAADQQAFEARVNRFAAASNLGPPVIATPGAAA